MSISAKLRAGLTTDSAEQTRAIAAEWARTLPKPAVLALHGDMGVGKTTFVQGLAHGLGVPGAVTSPTFAIYSVHQGTSRTLVHLDAYRLKNEHDLEGLLLDEFLSGDYCLAVEWPERITGWLPADTLQLTFSILDGDRHHLMLR